MKIKRKIIQIDEELCNGCGECVPSCAEGTLQIIDGKARVVSDNLCDGLGACLGECPQGALSIIEREAEEFNEHAVEAHLKKREMNASPGKPVVLTGCPSAAVKQFSPVSPCDEANRPSAFQSVERSALSHWPVQIRLVPPTAPFLKGADLLVLADCVPVAFPSLHREFLKGRAVMMGCPKFDDVQEYIDKFAEVFKIAGLKSITTVVMEVPCCSALPMIVKKGMEKAGKSIPMEKVVVSTRGEILKKDIF
ncbi:MAG: 4Fe-4S binding protein [Thermodesulfobacteriota bacterium]